MEPHDFVNKWQAAELKERSAAQEHWIDLCRMLGQPTPAEHVKPWREERKKSWFRKEWWQLYARRPDLRAATDPLKRFIATPRVAKHRLFVWLRSPTVPDCQLIVFAREDDYFFGVLHSIVHERWALRLGTQLRERTSGFRYTPTTCFETFPFPWPPGQEPARVAAVPAAQPARGNRGRDVHG